MVWRGEPSRAVQDLKRALIQQLFCKSSNPGKPITIKTDAAKDATGAVLEQGGAPVAFESRKTRERGNSCLRTRESCVLLPMR